MDGYTPKKHPKRRFLSQNDAFSCTFENVSSKLFAKCPIYLQNDKIIRIYLLLFSTKEIRFF